MAYFDILSAVLGGKAVADVEIETLQNIGNVIKITFFKSKRV